MLPAGGWLLRAAFAGLCFRLCALYSESQISTILTRTTESASQQTERSAILVQKRREGSEDAK